MTRDKMFGYFWYGAAVFMLLVIASLLVLELVNWMI